MKRYLPTASVLTAGILWGMIGIYNRRLTAAGLSSLNIVFLRNIGCLIVLTVIFLLQDRSIFRINWRHLHYFFGTGVLSVLLFSTFYFTCQQYCSLAAAAVLLYTSPAFVVLLSAVFFHERISKRKVAALLLALAGCCSVSGIFSGTLQVTAIGLLFGILSGFFYSLYSIFGRIALRTYGTETVTFYTFLFAGLGSCFIGSPVKTLELIARPDLILTALCLILFSTVAPYLLYTYGLKRMESGRAAILACVEPVAAAVVGIICFSEPITQFVFTGLACIILCVILLR